MTAGKSGKPRLEARQFSSTAVEVNYDPFKSESIEISSATTDQRWLASHIKHVGTGSMKETDSRSRRHSEPIESHSRMNGLKEECAKGSHCRSNSTKSCTVVNDCELLAELFPAYPFPADFDLESSGSKVHVCQHLGLRREEKEGGTSGIVIFIPGICGGVGPGRQPGDYNDEDAIFAKTARQLAQTRHATIDCYRLSWPHSEPDENHAIKLVIDVVRHAIESALQGQRRTSQSNLRIFMVGHSFGGGVAIQAAATVARCFEGKEITWREHAARVMMSGICTLNSSMSSNMSVSPLKRSHALLICGDADSVVPYRATLGLYDLLPMEDKLRMVLPGGTHDLFSNKMQVIDMLEEFVRRLL